jgi:hypothetical protein
MSAGYRGLDPAPPLPPGLPAALIPIFGQIVGFLGRIREVANNLLRGKLNATLDVTLKANAGTTTVTDPRIGGTSCILPCPLSIDAATELGNGTMWFAAPGDQSVVINHANNPQADRNFRLLIIG